MAVELTPAGTRGASTRINNRIVVALFMAFYRLSGGRGMGVLGARTLFLTTVGARTGQTRTSPPSLRSTQQAQRSIPRRHPRQRRRVLERADLRRA